MTCVTKMCQKCPSPKHHQNQNEDKIQIIYVTIGRGWDPNGLPISC